MSAFEGSHPNFAFALEDLNPVKVKVEATNAFNQVTFIDQAHVRGSFRGAGAIGMASFPLVCVTGKQKMAIANPFAEPKREEHPRV
jgi:hypothetical protein